VCAADQQAVPVLIGLLADLPGEQQWQAEEILHGLAGAKAPQLRIADDAATRQKCREAWRAWYAAHGAKAKLAPRPLPPLLLGFTTIAAFSPPPDRTKSRILAVDRHGKVGGQCTCT